MADLDPKNHSEQMGPKARRTQKIILIVMVLLMFLPGLLAWILGAIRF